ncbi:MAG: radical SAM protein [Deltaproteobacteria bacterium]|nr:radical SAM protein [Deltaproteobacteria bacterium]
MLPVSELVEVARGQVTDAELRARSPLRFSGAGQHAPVVIWNVCMHCNMTCPHCYAAAVAEPSPTDLTHEEGLRLLDDLASCGVRVVIFSGGEPLLRKDLLDLIRHARSLGIAPQLSTNGVLIDREVAAELAEAGVAYVGISIDGLPDFNDGYRGLEGGYEAALRGLQNAKRVGMKTGLRMTLTRRNVDQLSAMVEVAQSVDVDRFYVSHLVYSGRGFKVAHEDLSRAQVRKALLLLFELAEELAAGGLLPKIVTGSNDSDGVFLRGGNSAGERILDIDSRGRVHPDQFWRGAVLGDVRKESFAKILEHPLREQLSRRLELLTGRCGSCTQRALCRGSHRERALARYRDPWASDPACVMEDSEIGISEGAQL